MEVRMALDLGTSALMAALILSAPIMVVGLVVGLVISVLQAVTQLQEQTLSFVPKIIAMFVATALFLPWLTQRSIEYATELWSSSPWSN